jgi:hypothetical protein
MAVVPTAHHVTLTYGTTGADQLGKLASLGGVVGLGILMTLRPPVMRQANGVPETPSPPAPGDGPEGGLPPAPGDGPEGGLPPAPGDGSQDILPGGLEHDNEPGAADGPELYSPLGAEPDPSPEAGHRDGPGDDTTRE